MSYRVVVVDPHLEATEVIEQALVTAGYSVTVVRTLKEGVHQIPLVRPEVVVASVRLGEFSGLHLLLRCRADWPNVQMIIVGAPEDFTSDIGRYGARFQPYPIDGALLVRLVAELLTDVLPLTDDNRRRWLRRTAEVSAVVADFSTQIVDFSCGGFRMKMPLSPADLGSPFRARLPALGVSVTALPRWSRPCDDAGFWWCGAEVARSSLEETRTWRWIIEALG
jgi:CheY-like chemotaxis protein